MDYKARFYSPVLDRFIQPDSIVPGMFNPQNLNRFSYVRNNPIIYTDPTGHEVCADNFCFDQGTKTTSGSHTNNGCTNNCWSKPNLKLNPSEEPITITNILQSHFSSPVTYQSILIGMSSVHAPPQVTSYGQIDDSCWNCSVEPNLPPNLLVLSGGADLLVDIGNGYNTHLALNSEDIPVYANIITHSNGSMSVPSIYVQNETNLQITVANVMFTNCPPYSDCSGFGPSYQVVQTFDTIQSLGIYIGLAPLISANTNVTIPISPSGNNRNPNNHFFNTFTISVQLANSQTGQRFLPISISYP